MGDRGNEVRLNAGAGINGASRTVIRSNTVHHNAQIGIKVSLVDNETAHDAVVSENTVSYNAFPSAGFNSWEAGGTKFAHPRNLRVERNVLHDNFEAGGIWLDMENAGALIEKKRCYDNDRPGIWYERQDRPAVIRLNTVKNNCRRYENQANISIQC